MARMTSIGGAGILSGTLAAGIAALVFGMLWIAVGGVALALTSGLPVQPALLPGLVAGLGSAAAILWLRGPMRRWAGFAAALVLLLAAGLGRPFGLSLAEGVVWQGIGILLIAAAIAWSLWLCLHDAPTGRVRRYDFERLMIRVARGAGFILFSIFVILPFYVMVMTSLKSQAELMANPLDFSIDLSRPGLLTSYTELFEKFNFGTYLLNSTIVSVSTVLVTLVVSVPGAYAVSRLRFRGRDSFANAILLIYMVPAIVLVLPLYAVFSQLELRNSLLGLLIVYPATTIPVALYMLQGYFRGLPAEMEEAGLMDGLSRLGVILKITLPLSLPALASVGLYVFMIAWNEFLFAFMFLDDPAIFTLPRGVASLNSSELPRELMMAGAVIATVPVMVVFVWLERFMVQGLSAGAVKG